MSKKNYIKKNDKYEYQGVFIAIPKIIYENKDLNATDKLILSWIHGFKKTWNPISTKTIAEMIGLKVSTINHSVKKLVLLELLEEKYIVARKRSFRSLLPATTDAVSLITDDVLADNELSSTYKITIGVIAAASRGKNNFIGGYNFNSIKELAALLGIAESSVYRHLQVLRESKLVSREYAQWTIKPLDAYSKDFAYKQERKQAVQHNLEEHATAPPMAKETESILDRIFDIF